MFEIFDWLADAWRYYIKGWRRLDYHLHDPKPVGDKVYYHHQGIIGWFEITACVARPLPLSGLAYWDWGPHPAPDYRYELWGVPVPE